MRHQALIAPIHALKGYHDNLFYVFRRYILPEIGEQSISADKFGARFNRMQSLCDLLEFTVIGGSTRGEWHFTETDFANVILLPIVQPLRRYAQNEKEVSVHYTSHFSSMPILFVCVDAMRRCLFNLIINGIKYSSAKSNVMIELGTSKDCYEVHVVNRGIGVPNGEEEEIFERFRQGSNTDVVSAYGAGLGLFVARRMAQIHGGNVILISGKPEETRFALRLPKTLSYGPPSINRKVQ